MKVLHRTKAPELPGTEADASRVNTKEADVRIGLLTGGDDRSYALGLASALVRHGVHVDFIGSDRVDGPELHGTPLVNFLNLRGDQSENANLGRKMVRLLLYYARLLTYAAFAKPRIFHILWNNKFETFDRTALMVYYRLLGRKVALTAHNVNAARRDAKDSALNRLSLRIQYRLSHHIFVHTDGMKRELQTQFAVPDAKVSVIPFGVNNTIPTTDMTIDEAKRRLGVCAGEVVALFFGQIAPYKGLEYLVDALPEVIRKDARFRLIIAGKVKKGSEDYWRAIERKLSVKGVRERVITRVEHIPDEEVEQYLKGADVLVLPYTHIYQSGVPFLSYSFGLPVIATDVGSLREDVIEGKTGFICKPRDSADLARVIQAYFSSAVWRNLESNRSDIRKFANERHSWVIVADITESVYRRLLAG
jgi:glycosyltransferase involved in cell wall biosynthesis